MYSKHLAFICRTQERPAYTWVFNFHTLLVCSYIHNRSKLTPTFIKPQIPRISTDFRKVGNVGKVKIVAKLGKLGKVRKVGKVGKEEKVGKVGKEEKVGKVGKVRQVGQVGKEGKV